MTSSRPFRGGEGGAAPVRPLLGCPIRSIGVGRATTCAVAPSFGADAGAGTGSKAVRPLVSCSMAFRRRSGGGEGGAPPFATALGAGTGSKAVRPLVSCSIRSIPHVRGGSFAGGGEGGALPLRPLLEWAMSIRDERAFTESEPSSEPPLTTPTSKAPSRRFTTRVVQLIHKLTYVCSLR